MMTRRGQQPALPPLAWNDGRSGRIHRSTGTNGQHAPAHEGGSFCHHASENRRSGKKAETAVIAQCFWVEIAGLLDRPHVADDRSALAAVDGAQTRATSGVLLDEGEQLAPAGTGRWRGGCC